MKNVNEVLEKKLLGVECSHVNIYCLFNGKGSLMLMAWS